MTEPVSKLALFPINARVNDRGHLNIGDCDTIELAAEYGAPLYLYDEDSLRAKTAELKTEFGRRYITRELIICGI